jgi:hypothetical protein
MFQYYLWNICDATNSHAVPRIGTSSEQVCDYIVISWGSSHLLNLFRYGLCTQAFPFSDCCKGMDCKSNAKPSEKDHDFLRIQTRDLWISSQPNIQNSKGFKSCIIKLQHLNFQYITIMKIENNYQVKSTFIHKITKIFTHKF